MVYIIGTYYQDSGSYTGLFATFDIIFSISFTVDFIIDFLGTKNKKKFLLETTTFVDILTILPAFVTLIDTTNLSYSTFVFIGFIRLMKVLRVIRLHRVFKKSSSIKKVETN